MPGMALCRLLSCSIPLLLFLSITTASAASDQQPVSSHPDEPFIGWNGETYRPKQPGDTDRHNKWVETISWSPRAFVYHNFLSEEEVKHMLDLVEKQVARSYVVDTKTGVSKLDPIRTSYGAAITRGQTPVIAAIEARIAEWTRLPPDHGEPIQVLRYQNGQKYDAHWDWFDDPVHNKETGENRVATVLLYLGELVEGGETSLPIGIPIDEERQKMVNPSPCAANGSMAVVPRRGDALLFWDMYPNGTEVDRASLHSSCPTIKGTKWTATKWIHNRPYGTGFDPLKLAAECKDTASDCSKLVAAGKCDTDPAKMLGITGTCRRSCNDCIDCSEGDLICLRKNMRSQRQRKAASAATDAAPH